jgi:hypothetical protein
VKLSPGDWFLLIISVQYLAAAGVYGFKVGNPGYALCFVCYALANVGLIWAGK